MMAERMTYHVFAERDAKWWVLKVAELGQWSQSKRLDQAEATARDLIALWLDVPADSFDVELTVIRMSMNALAARDAAVDVRRAADAAAARASEATRLAVTILTEEGLSLRDIGRILGISFQRVQQLAASPEMIGEQAASRLGCMDRLRNELRDATEVPGSLAVSDTATGVRYEANVVRAHATARPKSPTR